jgi:Protein of unknown function (DUF2911)
LPLRGDGGKARHHAADTKRCETDPPAQVYIIGAAQNVARRCRPQRDWSAPVVALGPLSPRIHSPPMMTRTRLRFFAPALALGALSTLAALPLSAQANLRAGASGRATTVVTLAPPRVPGQPAPKAFKVSVDYGVPVARGRVVAGALADDLGKVWRLGANEATTMVTEVDLVIGGTPVPKGTYSLFAETTKGAWKLIVSKKTGQWGTEYDQAMDLARIPLKSRTLASPVEAFTLQLIPSNEGAKGELRFAWGTLEHSVEWAAK